jgi:hypothetical protein
LRPIRPYPLIATLIIVSAPPVSKIRGGGRHNEPRDLLTAYFNDRMVLFYYIKHHKNAIKRTLFVFYYKKTR